MKKFILVSLISLTTTGVIAQGNKTASASPHLKVFKQSVMTGDISTGIAALNYYVNEAGADPVYEDTLAMLYMQKNSFVQCFYWADKRLKVNPDDLVLLEMKGICLDKLNQPKEAIAVFEKLYAKTKSPYHAYTLMDLQYGIKRLAECLSTAASAEKLEYKPEYTISYNVGDQVGRTYLQAGIFNITGLTLYDLDKKADALKYFEKAIALDSNFVLARQNLEAVKAEQAGTNKTNSGNNNNQSSPANKND